MDDLSKILKTASVLRSKGMKKPSVGIILGTGLGRLARSIRSSVSLDFEKCPFFPKATSIGHSGRVVYGKLHNKTVIAMEGRFHFFEGYSLKEVTYPVRVMKELGVRDLILSNAAGAMNPKYRLGDIMIITDHVNFMGDSPLSGANDDRLGPRFPDMSQPYHNRLIQLASRTARKMKLKIHKGVYVAVKGPNLETRAEYRFLRQMGADTVGMSTVPEVIVAAHAGLRTLALSCVTDMCLPDELEPVDIEKILSTARKTEPILTQLVSEIIREL